MPTFLHTRLAASLLLISSGAILQAADDYVLGPDSTNRMAGAPAGRVEAFEFNDSKVYPGTTRGGWVYIPAQYDAARPAALMVFMDGHAYAATNGQQRATIVFDNLIHRGEMPVTVGIFINPGHRGTNAPAAAGWGNRNNRSLEYDSLGGDYAKFLIGELLPFVTNRFALALSADPDLRAVAGMSSGGICAFTVAWERPDQFRKVLSQIGSFTNIRGGDAYPGLIRKTERKPLRVFLQDGSNDLNNLHGNWPLANQQMASALGFAGYDHRLVFGDGAHNGKHGGAILPDSLRWLWRPVAPAPAPSTNNWAGDEALNKVLPGGGAPGDWELVGEGYGFTDAACADAQGNFYFSDLPKATLYRQAVDGAKPVIWLEGGPKISGMKFGPDGKLYAATQGEGTNTVKRLIVIDPVTKAIETVATDVNPNDLIVSKAGFIYYTDTGAGAVVRVPISARGLSRPAPVAGGINRPNGIALMPAQDVLLVSEYGGTNVWTFLVDATGDVTAGERYMTLRVPAGRPDSGGDGMTVDAAGRSYVTSHAGIQMFDWTGRLGGVISRPQDKGTVSCALAGAGGSYLYACSSDKVYRRKTLTAAAKIP